jgi:hypothetical protein
VNVLSLELKNAAVTNELGVAVLKACTSQGKVIDEIMAIAERCRRHAVDHHATITSEAHATQSQ